MFDLASKRRKVLSVPGETDIRSMPPVVLLVPGAQTEADASFKIRQDCSKRLQIVRQQLHEGLSVAWMSPAIAVDVPH
jgi:hypothetical protein